MLIVFIIPISVKADHIYDIDMDIYIDKYGNAEITEVWDVKADSGSEWYKTMYNLDGSNLFNYVVYMDGVKLDRKFWKVSESLSEKAGYYGTVYTDDGIELCFGKNDMKRHTFTLKYTISNYIFNTNDSQVLYWTLIPKIKLDNFTIDVTSYYSFSDTLDVWGYGYRGYAYVKDGKINMSNEKNLHNQYVVLLVKFPLNTFETDFKIDEYINFNDVYKQAEKGTFKYINRLNEVFIFFKDFLIKLLYFLLIFILVYPSIIWKFIIKIFKILRKKIVKEYGYINNKKINKKNVLMFRDIPCNKDIYYANTLIKLNNFDYNKTNIFGAIILKWVKYNKISFNNFNGEVFDKDTSVIDLTKNPVFDTDLETNLFNMIYKASNDGYLEVYEFEKWCKKNYSKFLNLFDKFENEMINKLKKENLIRKRIYRKECKKENVLTDIIYNDSVKLYGFKKYLNDFSKISTKEVMEVKLWDEYLIFAYLFGIADKVAKQLKNIYPEIVEQINFDYDMVRYISLFSNNTFRVANISKTSKEFRKSARKSAESYSFGGGGFSSSGGGGGSRGGGGSAGGR